MQPLKPHPSNVPGDYYVQDSCCTMCNVPFVVAPELFGEINDERGFLHCFVKRQPTSDSEHALMVEAIASAELSCIRYSGRDSEIQKQLIKVAPSEIDNVLPKLRFRYFLATVRTRRTVLAWRVRNSSWYKHLNSLFSARQP